MAQTSIDPKVLEDAIRSQLETPLPTSPGTRAIKTYQAIHTPHIRYSPSNLPRDPGNQSPPGNLENLLPTYPRTRAINPYQEISPHKVFPTPQSQACYEYFRDKYSGGDLDTIMLFAALFSAIATSFILAIQTQLQPDYSQLNYAVLMFIANSTFQNMPDLGVSPDKSIWTGPDSTIVHVQAVLFSSLAISLLAAFIAMLSKQWLSCYSESYGSHNNRGRYQYRGINGVTAWHLDLIMECLPLLLQAALFLFSYALSIYLFTINNAVAAVTIGFTSFGLLFYFLIVFAGTLSYNCPFQTPLSRTLRFLFRLENDDKNYLGQAWSWLKRVFSGRCFGRPHRPGKSGVSSRPWQSSSCGDFESSAGRTAQGNNVLEAEYIARLSHMSRSAEIVWPIGISQATLLEQLYDTILEYFDFSSNPPVLIPTFRDRVYLTAKALIHLAVQRNDVDSERNVFQSISMKHRLIGSRHYNMDSDLESTLGMVDRVLKDEDLPLMHWEQFSFTAPHHTWMAYIFRCHAWRTLRNNNPLPGDVEQFVLHSLRSVPPPPAPIVVECLHIIGLVLGTTLQDYDQQAIDESYKIWSQIDSIYSKLERLWNDDPTEDEIDRALKAMKLVAPLSMEGVAEKSYTLFHVFMNTPISPVRQKKKWEASRLALRSACKGGDLPPVNDPQDVLTFLNYHFELALQGENQDEPIQNALHALTSDFPTIEAPVHFDLTQPSFVRGIRFAFKADRPRELREAALFFLSLISDKWFDAARQIIPDEMESFCQDWATVVDSSMDTRDDITLTAVLLTLFHVVDSPYWRRHIPNGKWELLKYYSPARACFLPPKRFLENPESVDAVSRAGDPNAIVAWSNILWLNYTELATPVQEALKKATKAAPRSHIDDHYEAVETRLRYAESEKMYRGEVYADRRSAATLDRRIRGYQEARDALEAIKNQVDVD